MTTTYPVQRLFFALVALVFVASACASTPDIPSKPLPPGITLSGDWYSNEYEKMVLEQKGTKVIGTFSYKSGGVLEGELKGNVLYFDWEQPGDFSVARRHVGGKGYLIVSDDGKALNGRWGYGDELDTGGVWTAERIVDDRNEVIDGPIF